MRRKHQAGAGIVETMVGILVGLLVILAIYSMVSASEGYRRTATGASDAQITGLLSQFILGRDAGNGGNGLTLSAATLFDCIKNEAGLADLTMKPIPVLITDSGDISVSDSFIAMNSGAPRVIWPVDFVGPNSVAGADFEVQSPAGFSSPAPTVAAPYLVIAAANDGTGRCGMFKVTSATRGPSPFGDQGEVRLTTVPPSTITYSARPANLLAPSAVPARLINLGPVGLATRIQYEARNTAVGEPCGLTPSKLRPCQLTSVDLLTPGAPTNPIAANVVLMKIQYGVDTSAPPDNIIDCWTPADNNNTCNNGKNYTAASVQNMPLADINRILAVRVAVVVRSDEPDLKDTTLEASNPLGRPPLVLFNCAANDLTCQSRITLPRGNGTEIIQDYWRYRSYETVVPLRNAIYSSTMP